jgi:hypothetical protein
MELKNAITFGLGISLFLQTASLAAGEPSTEAGDNSVAVAIVMDTSGSMQQSVLNQQKKPEAKYLIANRALLAIVSRLEAFTTNQPAGKSVKLETGLIIFERGNSSVAIPFGPFNPRPLRDWAQRFNRPEGNTPLGEALRVAAQNLLNSKAKRKHVIIITDGENTSGPDPATVLPQVQKEAERKGALLGVHFIAFDMAAKVFDKIKANGATVLAAANESQLQNQLAFILENKVLLED